MSTAQRNRGAFEVSGNDARLTSPSRRSPVLATRSGRRRSWSAVTLSALLVVASGLAVAAWGLHAGQKESVVTVRGDLVEGHVIERSDLASASVAGVGDSIPLAQIDTVVGKTTTVDLVAGQILTGAAITSSTMPAPGQAMVGLSLDPTRVPVLGLAAGDRVDVIAVPGPQDAGVSVATDGGQGDLDAPEVLATGAFVFSAQGDAVTGGQLQVTVVVASDAAARIAAYSTQDRLALVVTADGDGPGAEATGAP